MSRSIRVYIEGGGDSESTKSQLRLGFQRFMGETLDRIRVSKLGPRIIFSGGRDQAYKDARNALKSYPDDIVFLLVDSEEFCSTNPKGHVAKRDGWDTNSFTEDRIHLMVQIMETWIICDLEALRKFYGSQLNEIAKMNIANVESVSKSVIMDALKKATNSTTKGIYHKIKHASKLLELVDAGIVRKYCPSCDNFFNAIEGQIEK
jgi:hypothetical protein